MEEDIVYGWKRNGVEQRESNDRGEDVSNKILPTAIDSFFSGKKYVGS